MLYNGSIILTVTYLFLIQGEPLRNLALECGLDMDQEKTSVIDHINYEKRDEGYHNLVVVKPKANLIDAPVIVGNSVNTPLLYRGLG